MPEAATVSGQKVSKSDFAYAPGDKASDWKLPIHDAAHVRAALARWNQTDLPSDAKAAAHAKILAAAKRFGVEVSASGYGERASFLRLKDLAPDQLQTADMSSVVAQTADGRVKSWVKVFPRGASVVYQGETLHFDDRFCSTIVSNFDAVLTADYDHQSDPSLIADPDIKRASGQVHELQERPDGVWALVNWTASAVEYIRAGEWNRISPEFSTNWLDKYSGQEVGPKLRAIGLVNRPFLEHDMPPVKAKESGVQNLHKVVDWQGGGPASMAATETGTRVSHKEQSTMAKGNFQAAIRKHLGLDDAAPGDTVTHAAMKRCLGLDDGVDMDDGGPGTEAAMAAFSKLTQAKPEKTANVGDGTSGNPHTPGARGAPETVAADDTPAMKELKAKFAELEATKKMAEHAAEQSATETVKLSERLARLEAKNTQLETEKKEADVKRFCDSLVDRKLIRPNRYEAVKKRAMADLAGETEFWKDAEPLADLEKPVGVTEKPEIQPNDSPRTKYAKMANAKMTESIKAGKPMTFSEAERSIRNDGGDGEAAWKAANKARKEQLLKQAFPTE